MRQRCIGLGRQRFPFESRVPAARNSNVTVLEHGYVRNARWRVWKIQDRHIDLLTVERGDHMVAIERQHPQINCRRDLPQVLDERHDDGG